MLQLLTIVSRFFFLFFFILLGVAQLPTLRFCVAVVNMRDFILLYIR